MKHQGKNKDNPVGYCIGKSTRLYPKRMTKPPWDNFDNNWDDEYNRLRSTIYPSIRAAERAAHKAKKYNPVGFDVHPIYNPIKIVEGK